MFVFLFYPPGFGEGGNRRRVRRNFYYICMDEWVDGRIKSGPGICSLLLFYPDPPFLPRRKCVRGALTPCPNYTENRRAVHVYKCHIYRVIS